MKIFDTGLMHELSAHAAQAPRRRKNHNLHAAPDDPVQRMLNAFEPATYVRPHRHIGKWELFVFLSGRAAVLCFDDAGCVGERVELFDAGTRVIEIPAGRWHSIVSLAPRTVLFEVKAGPYVPTGPEDFASWAPPEGDASAAACEQWLCRAAVGDIFSRS